MLERIPVLLLELYFENLRSTREVLEFLQDAVHVVQRRYVSVVHCSIPHNDENGAAIELI